MHAGCWLLHAGSLSPAQQAGPPATGKPPPTLRGGAEGACPRSRPEPPYGPPTTDSSQRSGVNSHSECSALNAPLFHAHALRRTPPHSVAPMLESVKHCALRASCIACMVRAGGCMHQLHMCEQRARHGMHSNIQALHAHCTSLAAEQFSAPTVRICVPSRQSAGAMHLQLETIMEYHLDVARTAWNTALRDQLTFHSSKQTS